MRERLPSVNELTNLVREVKFADDIEIGASAYGITSKRIKSTKKRSRTPIVCYFLFNYRGVIIICIAFSAISEENGKNGFGNR